jgi:hypothetical protein
MFQRDDSQGGIYVDTAQVYSWKQNTSVFYTEMAQKQAVQRRFFTAVARAYPGVPEAHNPPTSWAHLGTTTTMTALEAGTMTLYNTADGCPPTTLGGTTYKNPWTFNPSDTPKWQYHDNSQNYCIRSFIMNLSPEVSQL